MWSLDTVEWPSRSIISSCALIVFSLNTCGLLLQWRGEEILPQRKYCHIHLMCIRSMRHNKQQWPAWLLKACWMQAEDNSCLDTTMAALSLNPIFTLKKKTKKTTTHAFFFFFYSSLSPRHICISDTRQQRNPWTNRFGWKCVSKLMNRTSRRMTVFQCRAAALTTLRCTWQNMELSQLCMFCFWSVTIKSTMRYDRSAAIILVLTNRSRTQKKKKITHQTETKLSNVALPANGTGSWLGVTLQFGVCKGSGLAGGCGYHQDVLDIFPCPSFSHLSTRPWQYLIKS